MRANAVASWQLNGTGEWQLRFVNGGSPALAFNMSTGSISVGRGPAQHLFTSIACAFGVAMLSSACRSAFLAGQTAKGTKLQAKAAPAPGAMQRATGGDRPDKSKDPNRGGRDRDDGGSYMWWGAGYYSSTTHYGGGGW